jgi:O-antigen/teichoic acid export membrane protein
MSEIEPISVSVKRRWYHVLYSRDVDSRFGNSASWVGTRAISGLARLGILLAIARAYGPESFGKLSLSISVVEILRVFSDFGIDTISIRKFTQTIPAKRAELLEVILGAKLFLATCFYSLAAGVLFVLANDHFEVVLGLVAGLSLFFSSALGAFSSYLQSFFSMSRIFRTSLLSSAASVVFASIAIHNKASLVFVIVALPLADALNLILFCSTSELRFRAKFDLGDTLSLLRASLPVGVTSALVILYFRLDTLFVFKFAGAAALGLYSACFRITEPALMIPQSFSTTAYTVLSSAERSNDSASDVIRTVLRTMWPAYAAIGAFALIVVFTGKVFLAWFFPLYLSAYRIMAVLSIALLVRSLNIALTAIFNSRAMYSTVTRIAAVNLSLNLVLVLFLAQKYGALGAAWAALLGESVNTLIQVRSVAAILRFPKGQLVLGNVNLEG